MDNFDFAAAQLARVRAESRIETLKQVLVLIDNCGRDIEQAMFRVEALLRVTEKTRQK